MGRFRRQEVGVFVRPFYRDNGGQTALKVSTHIA